MKKKARNWWMGLLWRMGLVDLPWWDDVRIVEDEERVPTVSGEPLRAALSARRGWKNAPDGAGAARL